MYFAVSDIHGHYNEFQKILKNWNPESEQLIVLGDLIDRGPNSKGVLKLAKKLKEDYGAIITLGNHEDMFLNWLQSRDLQEAAFSFDFFKETLESFDAYSPNPRYAKRSINIVNFRYSDYIEFLLNLPLYLDEENVFFSHAGLNLKKKHLNEMNKEDFIWSRKEFYLSPKKPKKAVFFGHTPTFMIHPDKSSDIWISDCGKKIGIDGGSFKTGTLNGVKVDREGNVVSTCQSL